MGLHSCEHSLNLWTARLFLLLCCILPNPRWFMKENLSSSSQLSPLSLSTLIKGRSLSPLCSLLHNKSSLFTKGACWCKKNETKTMANATTHLHIFIPSKHTEVHVHRKPREPIKQCAVLNWWGSFIVYYMVKVHTFLCILSLFCRK